MLFFIFTTVNLLIHFDTYQQMVLLWEGEIIPRKEIGKITLRPAYTDFFWFIFCFLSFFFFLFCISIFPPSFSLDAKDFTGFPMSFNFFLAQLTILYT